MKDELEVRVYWHCELMCPNPVEYYQMTRSYESLRFEHDLLHCDEFSDEQIMLLASKLPQNQFNPMWIVVIIELFVLVTIGAGLILK